MQNAVAFANNDVITIAWSFGKKPIGCMGFRIYRIDDKNKETALPSQAVFKGQRKQSGQTTEQFPVQKFYWKDVYARLVAEKTGNRKFRYKIVPVKGSPGKLTLMKELPYIVSNEVEISSSVADNISAVFNRGLISTQRVARVLTEKKKKEKLLKLIDFKTKDPLRDSLSGDMVETLTAFLARAKSSGSIYAALYELGDAELIGLLQNLKKRLHIVLSDSKSTEDDETAPKVIGKDGKKKVAKKKIDANDPARKMIVKSGAEEHGRIMPNSRIGHNKFLVYVDKNGQPKAVLLGSTNWTATGLCAQTNNALIIEDDNLAKRYLQYWNQLKTDTDAAKNDPKLLQAAVLRKWDAKGQTFNNIDNIPALNSWFSPNTPKPRSSSKKNEQCPNDMKDLINSINGAKHSILFLAFYPGTPSVANWSAMALKKNKDLFVRGCVTNKSAAEGFYYELKGMVPPKKVKGVKKVIKQDYRVFGAEAFDSKVPKSWQKEILNAGFAIIHDKIMVIDPFSEDCVVATGSHNLGYKASYDNDENLVIVKGNKKLALAYATHVLDVYDHFSFRYWFKKLGETDYTLESTSEGWLKKYFDASGNIINSQLKFWLQATAPTE